MSPLEYFLDRGLGRGVADGLRARGWLVHRITDHYPDDAQCVPDEEWLAYGLERGWVPLCKDGRIKGRHHEREPIAVHSAVLFYLNNQQLRREEMISRFVNARPAMERAVRRGGPAVYAVAESTIRRTWP
ncbi:hypothetical protein [Saccharothrix sp. Mg75]|uniref:PIN-like domain-containing protein n=1 Tax=Saccharothrix sp. Mg75 TaxID=3445357 RepID=UPI003EEECB7C